MLKFKQKTIDRVELGPYLAPYVMSLYREGKDFSHLIGREIHRKDYPLNREHEMRFIESLTIKKTIDGDPFLILDYVKKSIDGHIDRHAFRFIASRDMEIFILLEKC